MTEIGITPFPEISRSGRRATVVKLFLPASTKTIWIPLLSILFGSCRSESFFRVTPKWALNDRYPLKLLISVSSHVMCDV
jgi:hypothetical protein